MPSLTDILNPLNRVVEPFHVVFWTMNGYGLFESYRESWETFGHHVPCSCLELRINVLLFNLSTHLPFFLLRLGCRLSIARTSRDCLSSIRTPVWYGWTGPSRIPGRRRSVPESRPPVGPTMSRRRPIPLPTTFVTRGTGTTTTSVLGRRRLATVIQGHQVPVLVVS